MPGIIPLQIFGGAKKMEERNNICWLSWTKLCDGEFCGGYGFVI